jgi:peptide/nickel transport system substrate-binding protein
MKKLMSFFAIIIVLAMLLAACGQATPTQAPAEEPAVEEPVVEEPVVEETEDTGEAIIAEEETQPEEPQVVVETYNEAPMLADMVAAGELPPVEERLPDNPVVTTPYESVGKYGGTLRTATWWPEAGNVQLFFAVDAPIKWKADLTGYEAGLAESWEWSEDGLTFTLRLRPGLKWSDGQPYTSADWQFMWDDILNDEDYKVRTVPGWLRKSDGTPIDMEFPDEYTVVWKSDQPLWIAPYYMAQGFWEFAGPMMKPAHYLKQFHPKYTETAKYEDLEKVDKWYENPDFPCLFAWCNKARAEDGTSLTFGRNPYFWRVDTEGNQLPYIDEIYVEIVSDEQVRLLNCSQGKYDAAFRSCGGPNDIPFLAEQADSGGYVMLDGWMNGAGAWPGYMVNQYYVEGGKNYTNDTPERAAEIRALLRDKRFRQALSHGLDRERMIEVVWNGIGDPKGATISPQSWHFASTEGQNVYKEWAAAYANVDVETANALLDEIGFVDANGDGWRDLNGQDLILTLDVTDWGGSLKAQTDAAAEAEAQWETNLKVQVEVKNLQGQPDVDTRTNEGYYMLRGAHISEIDIWTYPDWVFPIVNRYMFPLEGRYFQKGGEACTDQPTEGGTQYPCGVKPEPGSPADLLQQLYVKGLNTKTIDERHAVVWEAIEVSINEGPFVIGVAGDQLMPILINKDLRNVLNYGVVGPWAPSTPGNQIASQWYFDR